MSHSPALTPPAAPVWRTRHPANMWRRLQPAYPVPPRRGFTLVELLVVIGIIGLLAAISVPIVMQSLAKARTAAIKAEIDMLHMAIMNYKNEYGSFPPCSDTLSATSPATPITTRVRSHVSKIFPQLLRAGNLDSEILALNLDPLMPGIVDSSSMLAQIGPENSLYLWLSGYGPLPSPISVGRKPLYQFDKSRIDRNANPPGKYYARSAERYAYRYLDSASYFLRAATGALPTPSAHLEFDPSSSEDRNRNNQLDAGEDINANGGIDPPGEDLNGNMVLDSGEDVNGDGILNFGSPFNPTTFQILHPGRDGQFGTDDDLSNFWPGTRREFLDSLK